MSAAPRPFAPGHQLLVPLGPKAVNECVRRCRDLLVSRHGANPETLVLRPLRVTGKSQVVQCSRDGDTWVWKHHAQRFAFEHELAALRLYAATARVPRLLAQDEQEQVLLLEHLPRPFLVRQPADVGSVAWALGAVHAIADARDLERCFPAAAIGSWLQSAADRPAWVVDADAMQRALHLIASCCGAGHVPLGVGDIKPEHLFERDRRCVFIDLEGFRPGLPQQLDLLSLLNVAPGERLTQGQWADVLRIYQAARWAARPGMTCRELHLSIRLVGIAVGLPAELLP